ncbi:hypothetical protein LWX53_00840 [bacterium]|nr:hypothetical protein [bacterium]
MKPMTIVSRKRLIVRSALIAVYVALLVLMLLLGKRHTILIDNKEAEDGSYAAIDGMSVQIDSLASAEYYPGDRDKALVTGQRHKIKVEIFSESKVVEQSFSVPFGQDMVILSVPKLVAGIAPYLEPFVPQTESAAPSDAAGAAQPQAFGGDAAAPEAAPAAPTLIQ